MKRTFLVSTIAVAALLAGGMAIVALLTRPASMAPPEPAAPSSTTEAVAAAPPEAPTPIAARWLRPEGAAVRADPREPAGPAPTPMADRLTRKAVRKALLAGPVRSKLAGCTKEWDFGGTASDGGRAPRAQPAWLVLEIEALGGELRIVDARVRRWGGVSEAMVSCALTVLRSQAIPVPHGRRPDGARFQMDFSLNPRSEAVASSR